jgi:hypothetical protein
MGVQVYSFRVKRHECDNGRSPSSSVKSIILEPLSPFLTHICDVVCNTVENLTLNFFRTSFDWPFLIMLFDDAVHC